MLISIKQCIVKLSLNFNMHEIASLRFMIFISDLRLRIIESLKAQN